MTMTSSALSLPETETIPPVHASEPADRVEISLFGSFAVRINGYERPVVSRKLQALLAYLCFRKDASETRERLAALLWSESDYEKARASLRRSIVDLRLLFGASADQLIISSKLMIGLHRGFFSSDVDEVVASAEQGNPHSSLLDMERPVERLLEGIEDIDPEYRVWLLAKRRAYSDRLVLLLERALSDQTRDKAGLAPIAQAILALDPTHEVATRALMQIYTAQGAESRALSVYSRLWTILDEQFDSEPSPETQRLVVDIKRSQKPVAVETTGSREMPPNQLRLLCLIIGKLDLTAAEQVTPLALKGFRQQLIASLVRFREWAVFDEADHVLNDEILAKPAHFFRLQMELVVAGQELSILLTLKDAATGHCLWSETVDFQSSSWTEAHIKTIRQITTSLNVHISTARMHRIALADIAPSAIYDRWLSANVATVTYDVSRWEETAHTLRQIVHEAPAFSLGMRTLATWENARHIACPGIRRDIAFHEATAETARRAVELDPVDNRSHLCLAWSLLLVDEKQDALAHASMTVELNESDTWAMVSAANIMGFCGDVPAAINIADRALANSLVQSRTHLAYDASIRFMSGDYARCLKTLKRSGAGYPGAMAWRVAALVQIGDLEEARQSLQHTLNSVQMAWFGPDPPNQESAFSWFKDQFPVLDDDVRDRLHTSLDIAYAAL